MDEPCDSIGNLSCILRSSGSRCEGVTIREGRYGDCLALWWEDSCLPKLAEFSKTGDLPDTCKDEDESD